jgi:3-hydroxyacyl-CoA dehydrogenase/enoyl-CoA hydratase/3-hydroxybutyryl-CoA epimerase
MTKDIFSNFLKEINSESSRPAGFSKSKFKKIGIVGSGLMGHGIAYVSSYYGFEVVLIDKSKKNVLNAFLKIEKMFKVQVKQNFISNKKMEQSLGKIKVSIDIADLKGCELVIEAVYEDIGLKSNITLSAENIMEKSGVFSSNTSTIPIAKLAEVSVRPENFIGLHFFSPVHKMKLVEIIKSDSTSSKTLARALDFITAIKKIPIVVNDSPGFFTTRVFMKYAMEGLALLHEGNDAHAIEAAGKAAGFPVGPLAVLDEISLKVALNIRNQDRKNTNKNVTKSLNEPWDEVLSLMVNDYGRLGRINRKGFYDYPERNVKKLWPGLGGKITSIRNKISENQMSERLIFSQIIEALKCYDQGVLNSLAEANVGSVYGWGFPSPGVFSYIENYGIDNFKNKSNHLLKSFGNRFSVPSFFNKVKSINELFS